MEHGKIHPIVIIFTLIITGGIWQFWQILSEHYPITNFPPSGTNIIAFGDSITAGMGASSPEHGYVAVLEKRLSVTINNQGKNSDTTFTALDRLEEDVITKKPDIVLVELGGNDALQKLPHKDTMDNMRKIVLHLQQGKAVVVILGVPNKILGDSYAEEFKKIAEETGSLYVANILDGVLTKPQFMSDTIHPNDAGYIKIADKIAPTLEGLIRSATSVRVEK